MAEELSASTGVSFVRADVDSCQDASKSYSIEVLPTFLLFQNEEIVDTFIGQQLNLVRRALEDILRANEEVINVNKGGLRRRRSISAQSAPSLKEVVVESERKR